MKWNATTAAVLFLVTLPLRAQPSFLETWGGRSVQEMRELGNKLKQDCAPDGNVDAMIMIAQVEQANQNAALLHDIEMVDIPGGRFQMGCSAADTDCDNSEKPAHDVDVRAFRMSRYDVTVSQFGKFVQATGYRTDAERNTGGLDGCYIEHASGHSDYRAGASWRNPGFHQDKNEPVVCVSWNDAQAYAKWLSRLSDRHFRLPSEAEWEYAARAGSATPFYWGVAASHEQANSGADRCCVGAASGRDRWINTSPAGSFPPNRFGLFDMAGNVRQWTADCVNEDYEGAPGSTAPRTDGDCDLRVIRNGGWTDPPDRLRVSARDSVDVGERLDVLGFRLVQDR